MLSTFDQAVKYLKIREHSNVELKQKLIKKGYQDAEINVALKVLQAKGYQSDKRFSKAFIRSRIAQGKGKLLIAYELGQRGIKEANFDGIDFYALALQVRNKKFGKNRPQTPKEKAKQMRFLQSRGFSFDQITFCFQQ